MNEAWPSFSENLPPDVSIGDEYDIGELGPPLEIGDDYELSPSPATPHYYRNGRQPDYIDEFRKTPEYLNGQPYRRRCRTHLVLQQIHGRPVLLSHQRFKTAQALSADSLFAKQVTTGSVLADWADPLFNQVGDASERFYHPEINKQGGLHWTSSSRELTFLTRHLKADAQTELNDAYANGEKVHFNFLWGPRWKISRFGDQTRAYEWPRDNSLDDPNDFRGSNFVAFTKIEVTRNADGELTVSEVLLAEANLYTKVGSTRISPRGGPRGGIFLDRSLAGLKRRAEEGDIYLDESERLYNQAADLYASELSKSEEQWIRNALIDFLSDKVDRQGYSVKDTTSLDFKLDKTGDVIVDGNETNQEVRFRPIRVNVKRDSYLDGILRRMGERSHAFNRFNKYTHFEAEVYPIFKAAIDQDLATEATRVAKYVASHPGKQPQPRWQSDPREALARQLTHSEAMLNRFTTRSVNNLAYLLHIFSNDHSLDQYCQPGIGRAEQVLAVMRQINQRRANDNAKLHRPNFTDQHVQRCLDRLQEMQTPGWLPEEARSGLVLPISVDEPIAGVNHRRIVYGENNSNTAADDLFERRRNGKKPKPVRTQPSPITRENLVGFNVYPAKMTVGEVRTQLAEYGVEIIRALAREGDRPAIYALFMDPEPRPMPDGSELSPAQWINMLRRAFDTQRYTNGRSSKRAIEAGFQATSELAHRLAHNDPELANILEYFNYGSRLEATKESKAHSGAAGEIFTRIALNADLATMLGITEMPEGVDYKITYIDRDRRRSKGRLNPRERRKLNQYLTEINAENPDSDHSIRPDFVVQVTDAITGEITELWFDSKAYIKKITPTAIQNLYDHYRPGLNQHRRLVVVAHSPTRRITPEAQMVAHSLGVIIVGSDAVAAALTKADPEQLTNQHLGNLVEEYHRFKEHPSAFAENPDNRAGVATCEHLLDLQHTLHGPLFAEAEAGASGHEQLVYAESSANLIHPV